MLCPKCHLPLADEDEGPYICCADASLQWQCGTCGKVSEGFAFPYGRCPQCGGKLALREDGAAATADAAALNAVRMAFEIELGGRAFYQRAAADCGDDELRALFGRFAAMEDEHMQTLSRRYHVNAPESSNAFAVELAAVFGGVTHRPGDPGDLFRVAIALEKKAADFFAARCANATPGSAEQRLYLELGAEERGHVDLLTTEYERWRVRKPGLFSGDPQ
jgi:rubrerythrin